MTRKRILQLSAIGIVGAGLLAAQGFRNFGGGGPFGHLREFVAVYLDLTDAQKAQATGIFDGARAAAEPVVEQLKAGHETMRAAIKAGKSDAELQRIADQQGALMAQLAGSHAKAMAKFYAILTPEQKAKADKLHDLVKSRIGERMGRRMFGPGAG